MKSSSNYRPDITDKSMRKKLDKQARIDDKKRNNDVSKVKKRKQKELLDGISESTSNFGTKAVERKSKEKMKAQQAKKAEAKKAEAKKASGGFLKSLSEGFDKVYDKGMSKLKETQAKVDAKLDEAEAEKSRKKAVSAEDKQMKQISKLNKSMFTKK